MPVRSNSVDSSEIEAEKTNALRRESRIPYANYRQEIRVRNCFGSYLFSCIFRGIVHLGWYFVTRVHLRFVEVCFRAYLGLV